MSSALKPPRTRAPVDPEVKVSTVRPPTDRLRNHQGEVDRSSPRLPHERDESTDAASGPPRRSMRRAAADLKSGQVDTDRRQDALEVFNRSKPAR